MKNVDKDHKKIKILPEFNTMISQLDQEMNKYWRLANDEEFLFQYNQYKAGAEQRLITHASSASVSSQITVPNSMHRSLYKQIEESSSYTSIVNNPY
jgi:hypothetical protein